MIGDQNPCEATRLFLLDDRCQPAQKILPVPDVFEDPPPLDSSHHDMMQDPRSI